MMNPAIDRAQPLRLLKLSMKMWKRKRDGIWQVVFDDGQQRTLRTRDYDEALRLYKPIRREWLDGKLRPLTGRCSTTLGEYKKEYLEWAENALSSPKTFKANRLALNKLEEHAGKSCRLDRLGQKTVDLMVADAKKKNLSVYSINNYIRHARAALNKAVEWNYITKNPLIDVRELKVKKGTPGFLDKRQALEFLRGIKDLEVRQFATAAIATGRRRSELFYLRWEDVDLERGSYYVRKTKGQRFWAPINKVFRSVLLSFPERAGGRVFQSYGHPDTISHKIKKALVAFGHPELSLHSLRHTFASLKAAEGASLQAIQKLLGHEEIKATQIYAHLTDEFVTDMAEITLGPIDLSRPKPDHPSAKPQK